MRPSSLQMLLGQGVMQMTEMGDAEIGELEHKNRVRVIAGAAEVSERWLEYCGCMHVLEGEIVLGDRAVLAPAAQRVGDAGLDGLREMGAVGVVHGDDIRVRTGPYARRYSRSQLRRRRSFRSESSSGRDSSA